MKSWYLAVFKDKTKLLDAVALNERGMKSALKDFSIMLEKGATKVLIHTFEDDKLVSEEILTEGK